MNKQPITKQKIDPDGYLFIQEIFKSIQGEGPWVGKSVIFIRLQRCNLQCSWCDTEYTAGGIGVLSVKEILEDLAISFNANIRAIVITGGEPFAQNIAPLVNSLYDAGYEIQIETNGTLSLPAFPWNKVTLVCSPKLKSIHSDIYRNCEHFKYVTEMDEDGLAQLSQYKSSSYPPEVYNGEGKTIWLMPRDGDTIFEQTRNNKAALDLALENGYNYSPRLHKDLGVR